MSVAFIGSLYLLIEHNEDIKLFVTVSLGDTSIISWKTPEYRVSKQQIAIKGTGLCTHQGVFIDSRDSSQRKLTNKNIDNACICNEPWNHSVV